MTDEKLSHQKMLGIALAAFVGLACLLGLGLCIFLSQLDSSATENEDDFAFVNGQEQVDSDRFEPEPADVNPAHVDWLKQNAVSFSTIDPKKEDFSDLEPLKEIIGDAQVVQLGEQSHGDATCFETKVRLVKFLHQEMGFDVIAFESGLYDCHIAWQTYRKGEDAMLAAQEGVFGIWTGSAQTRELWNYIGREATGERPLQLAGFDCQFTADASREYLIDDIEALAQKYAKDEIDEDELRHFCFKLKLVREHGRGGNDKTRFDAILDKLIQCVTKATETAKDEELRDLEFWVQNLTSMKALAEYNWRVRPGPPLHSLKSRDAQMAANLDWLANEQLKGRKVIVWAASFHIVRNPMIIETPAPGLDYEDMIQMGELVDRTFGDKAFTIGFTTYEGRAGTFFSKGFPVDQAVEGTFEDLCFKAGLENALIPFKSASGSQAVDFKWLDEPIFSRPMGYSWMRASWPNHFDAMVFNKTMEQSTR